MTSSGGGFGLGVMGAHVDGGGRIGVHWPDVDEDVSAEGLLRGAPAPGGDASGVR